ncbi:hypothetical protein PM082_022347 [Marasmius tenuissimus]|nr:hypothetical protein PM082_022347 [Marasmius tenuissimus]
MAEWAHYSEIDPLLAPSVDALPALPANLPTEKIRGSEYAVTEHEIHIPGVIHHSVVPEKYKSLYRSIEQNKDAPILSRSGTDNFYTMYKPVFTDTKNSPLLLETQGSSTGVLAMLREAGVPTKLEVYPGVPHGFESVFPHPKQAVKLRKDTRTGLRWLLNQRNA